MPLPRALPAEVGVDPAAIAAFVRACAQDPDVELHSLMVLRHGRVIAEGWADPYRPEHQQLGYSLSKTFASAAVGIAVAGGALAYDDLMVDLFPDQVDERVGPKARSIRLRDVLAMGSGHTGDLIEEVTGGRPALARQHLGMFLRHEPEGVVGETFAYNQPCTWSAVRAVRERTGTDVHDLLRERVLDPLGADPTVWARDSDGCSLGFSGLHAATSTIAEFFQLLLDDGVRDGVRLLPQEWIEGHRRRYTSGWLDGEADSRLGYGWQVWMGQHGYRGDGAFGQFGLVLPEQDMVVAITSACERMQSVLDAAWDVLLPGVDRPVSPGGQAELVAALTGMALPPASGDSGGNWAGRDPAGRTLVVTEDTAGWRCDWDPGSGTVHSFQAGHGRWAETRLEAGGRSLRVAASAGRSPAGLVLELVFLNSPHRASLVMPASGGTADLVWMIEPLGTVTPWHLAQPLLG